MKKTTIIETIIFLYAVLLTYTGISKLTNYSEFKEGIAESPLLAPAASLVAWVVPLVEFAATVLLIIPRWRLKGLYVALILMSVFTAYVIGLLIFASTSPCSCGGIIQYLSWPQHIVLNCVFITLAVWGIALQKREKKSERLNWEINEHKAFSS
jgi:uncharacterized membrane protein YphA (DoxX/SURF4 family)